MKKQIILLNILIVLASATISSCGTKDKKTEKAPAEIKTDVFTCTMKCINGQTYDKPGTCTVCGMELEKVTKS